MVVCLPMIRVLDTSRKFTPDYRNWGGGLMTAQNQRLVYFHMIKSGDFEMMKPQFDFYLRSLRNAELRSEVYWGHKGACFTEQMENFGLPNAAEYGWNRPKDFDKGMEYNAWLEYEWDTALEFCLMILPPSCLFRWTSWRMRAMRVARSLRFCALRPAPLDSDGQAGPCPS